MGYLLIRHLFKIRIDNAFSTVSVFTNCTWPSAQSRVSMAKNVLFKSPLGPTVLITHHHELHLFVAGKMHFSRKTCVINDALATD